MRIEKVVGLRIARERESRGMTQAGIGEELGHYLDKPWPRQAVSAAEKGRRAFTAAELVAFALVLNRPVKTLLTPPENVTTVELGEVGSVLADSLCVISQPDVVEPQSANEATWARGRDSTSEMKLLYAARQVVSHCRQAMASSGTESSSYRSFEQLAEALRQVLDERFEQAAAAIEFTADLTERVHYLNAPGAGRN